MYPSEENPIYGVFVKNMVDGLICNGAKIATKATISKRPKNIFQYFFFYLKYFLDGLKGLFQKFDLIYVHYALHNAPLALLVGFISQKPLVVNIHGTDMLGQNLVSKFLGPFRSLLLHRANLIVVPSEFMKQKVIELTGLPIKKVFVSPSGGITIPEKIPSKKSNDETFTIGYVGRITEKKGIFILLEGLSYFFKVNPTFKWRLLVAGGGPEEKEFHSLVSKLNLEGNIIWNGPMPQNDLATLYDKLDVFVFPTLLEESLGLVGLEAMAHGVPVLGSKIGGLQEYISNGENGFLFEPGDANKITELLEIFIKTQSNNRKMSSNALITAKKYEDKKVSVELYEKLQTLLSI